jgi:ribosomal protein S4
MVRHGHVLVNDKKVSIGSAVLNPGDRIRLVEAAYKSVNYMQAKASPRLEIPDFLGKEGGENEVGLIREVPHAHDIPFPFEPGLVAEYYAARKA